MKLTKAKHGDLIKQRLTEGQSYRQIASEIGCAKDTVSIYARLNFPALRSKRVNQSTTTPGDVLHNENPMNLLVIDIETRPNLAYVWDVWQQNISPKQLIDEKEVISFAAKRVGEDEVLIFKSVHHDGKAAMVAEAWNLLDAADGVVTYNGKKFDIPHLNLEFLRAGMPPPSPFRQIDLLTVVRREFKFTHNKLDHVATKLGLGAKVEHEGFPLWVKCMQGDDEAWERMKEYNMADVLLTEKLYQEVLPWITNHPSYAALLGDIRCPNCGSTDLRNKGMQHTKTRAYKRYQCKSCGKYCRDTHCSTAAEVTETNTW